MHYTFFISLADHGNKMQRKTLQEARLPSVYDDACILCQPDFILLRLRQNRIGEEH
jgi:hypothetical protein